MYADMQNVYKCMQYLMTSVTDYRVWQFKLKKNIKYVHSSLSFSNDIEFDIIYIFQILCHL